MQPHAFSNNFPYLQARVLLGDSYYYPDLEVDIEALIDTGFSGGVSVPPNLIPSSLSPVAQTTWTLSDDSVIRAPTYRGYVRISGLPDMEVEIVAMGSQPLIGRSVTDSYRLTLDRGTSVRMEL